MCNFPRCRAKSTKTFALVPLCVGHYELIDKETTKFYKKPSRVFELKERPFYILIADQIPWSKMSMKQGDWK